MTGFAQSLGTSGATRWSWELKTVNAKGLDLRLRVPAGFDALEIEAKRRIGARLTRGTCHAALTLSREGSGGLARINQDLLASLITALDAIPRPGAIGPATLDGLLSIRGVIETDDSHLDDAEITALRAACSTGLDRALDSLLAMREGEGAALQAILGERLTAIGHLTAQADAAPQRQPGAIRDRLARSVALLVERPGLEPDRLHQEALLLAAKADVREELDRLAAHVTAARSLLATGGAVGRRLDFLAQELGREASTFCAKVNDAALTAIGLELRVEIEQFREQVQNIE